MAPRAGLKVWLDAVRTKFFLAGIPTVILGTGMAYGELGTINFLNFALAMAGIILVMIGTYTFNDYYDYKSGVDVVIRQEDVTPFNAGSRVLPGKLLDPSSVFKVGVASWILSVAIAIYFVYSVGPYIIPLSLAGFIAGALYTMPPVRWAYRGLGEFMIGLNYGILITLGSYYVQAGALPPASFLIPSLTPAALITAVIWINEFPDYHADKSVGKRNLVVRLGRERARMIYPILMISSYVFVVIGVVWGAVPLTGLAALATLPIAVRSIKICMRHYDDPQRLTPAMAGTIATYVLTTLIMASSYFASRVL